MRLMIPVPSRREYRGKWSGIREKVERFFAPHLTHIPTKLKLQVSLSGLFFAIDELVKNSIDAGASCLNIYYMPNCDFITIWDNGGGFNGSFFSNRTSILYRNVVSDGSPIRSTKDIGMLGGKGIGLAQLNSILEAYGGALQVENKGCWNQEKGAYLILKGNPRVRISQEDIMLLLGNQESSGSPYGGSPRNSPCCIEEESFSLKLSSFVLKKTDDLQEIGFGGRVSNAKKWQKPILFSHLTNQSIKNK